MKDLKERPLGFDLSDYHVVSLGKDIFAVQVSTPESTLGWSLEGYLRGGWKQEIDTKGKTRLVPLSLADFERANFIEPQEIHPRGRLYFQRGNKLEEYRPSIGDRICRLFGKNPVVCPR